MPSVREIIQTKRLILREICAADLDFVAEMLGDTEVMRYFPRCYSREESAAWIRRQEERYKEDGCGYWLAFHRAAGEPVGQVGPLKVDLEGVEEFALGYIIHRPYWGKGFATEAAMACRDFAFDTLDQQRVITLIRPENRLSQAVALKLGMVPERHANYAGFDHIVYAVSPVAHGEPESPSK